MGNPRHVLLDDGAVVQGFGDVVRGRADQFHAPFKRPVIGLGTMKRRQKRMVDINDVIGKLADKVARQNLLACSAPAR